VRVDIDVNTLKLGEIEFFEKESGLSFEELAQGKVNTAALIALITIQERRTNPSYSMDDARQIEMGSIEVEMPGKAPSPETAPEGDSSA